MHCLHNAITVGTDAAILRHTFSLRFKKGCEEEEIQSGLKLRETQDHGSFAHGLEAEQKGKYLSSFLSPAHSVIITNRD